MEARRLFSRIGFGYVLFFVADVAFQFMFAFCLGGLMALIPDVRVGTSLLTFVAQLARYGCAFPLMWLWMRRIPSWEKPQREKLSAGTFVLLIVFCFGITYIGNMAGQLLMHLSEVLTGIPVENPVDSMIENLGLFSLFFYTVILAPLMEELLFRKLLIDRIIPYGQKSAVIISGVAFGLYHGNFYQFFYACLIGMVFAYIYSRTGNFWYGVSLHAIINLVGGFLSAILYANMEAETTIVLIFSLVLGGFMIASIITAIVLSVVFRSQVKFFPGWAERPAKGFWRTILLAPGVLAFLAVCAVMFVLF